MPAAADGELRLRVAIVGIGPKGLFALERLLHHAHRAGPRTRLRGRSVRAASRPRRRTGLRPRSARLSAHELRRRDAGPVGRRSHGRERRRATLLRRLAPGGAVTTTPRSAIRRARWSGATWPTAWPACAPPRLRTSTITRHRDVGPRAPAARFVMDDRDGRRPRATRTTTRCSWRSATRPAPATGRARAWPHAAPLIPAVFPIARLAAAHVAPGATVAVRGFALTFLDAALALTEGRGGGFAPADHPYRLRYAPSPDDAGVIVPFSRTGRPMLAKPDPALAAGLPALETIARAARAQILAAARRLHRSRRPAGDPRGGGRGEPALRPAESPGVSAAALARRRLRRPRAADVAVDRPRRSSARSRSVRAWPRPTCRGRSGTPGGRSTRRSSPGSATAAWPAGSGRCSTRWRREMERVAFGPPAVNAAKLLALIAAGRVDLAHVAGGQLRSGERTTVIAGAHGERRDRRRDRRRAPAARRAALRRRPARAARRATGTPGSCAAVAACRSTPTAAASARDGHRTPGLSAIGRPTEDWVIGNDTLNRAPAPARRCVGAARHRPGDARADARTRQDCTAA